MEKETIVLYPSPGVGHVWSMVELAKLLQRRQPDKFSITILITNGFMDSPSLLSYLHRITLSNPSISFRHFPSIFVEKPSPQRSMPAVAFEFIRLNVPNVRQSLLEISNTSSIKALIIDFFCTSAIPIAVQLQIPVYYYFTSGASALSAYLFLPTIDKQISGSFRDLTTTDINIPSLPPFPASHMPEPILDRADPAYQDILSFSINLTKSDGILVNSFPELETVSVKAIADGLCTPDASTPPIYYVGPLISKTEESSAINEAIQHKCLSWLSEQPTKSVVFLCFGSRGSFSSAQLKEIAFGLERSGHRFLWVVKQPPESKTSKQIHESKLSVDLDELMPEGFFERTKDRGLVVESWAPQVEVLNHESVGGFVTHCGWNSVLEATVAGVPMVAWPLYAEQHVNRVAMVENMKVAITVEEGEDGIVSRLELEKRVKELMDSDSEIGRRVRETIEKMKESALISSTVVDDFLNLILS
ncbi:UDP-glycosyltransferase 88F4-like [Impatiens glandulifera]|uniref:UDP-glycosyltransferase 88F4-like n=1 Tax=Impatiens glandulifera TaxID=253017 RepID=UPI001FB1368A|nr:UDP-glycosyltransferase 88F4-like [Impatiens glandulifera]